jgi:hypothetical protein
MILSDHFQWYICCYFKKPSWKKQNLPSNLHWRRCHCRSEFNKSSKKLVSILKGADWLDGVEASTYMIAYGTHHDHSLQDTQQSKCVSQAKQVRANASI